VGGYEVWVTSESADEVTLVRFVGGVASAVATRAVGALPFEIDGPHGVAVSPNGNLIFVTLGHGQPNGHLWKIDTRTDEVVGRTELGLFPATVSVTPDGQFGFVSNFNLHGDPVPSSISKVHLPSMREVSRTETCVMPHGSRLNPEGTKHYSVCMMDERLVEIDAQTGQVSRIFSVGKGAEGPMSHDLHGDPAPPPAVTPPPTSQPVVAAADPPALACSPTWAEPSASGNSVFVTCNRGREVVEIDVNSWSVVRRFATGDSPYNLAVTPDGRLLLVSLRSRTEAGMEIYDLQDGQRLGKVAASAQLAHGIAVTSDSRYAFLSVEGVSAEPGRVDVIDLSEMRQTASVEVGQQATGIAIVP
jgi:DNA-binding beta-propeller fold protein YncE